MGYLRKEQKNNPHSPPWKCYSIGQWLDNLALEELFERRGKMDPLIMSNAIIIAIIAGSIFLFIAVPVIVARWVLRVNEQVYYLKQICQQLINLNNANAEARKSVANS